jgi:hypothetical protein
MILAYGCSAGQELAEKSADTSEFIREQWKFVVFLM